MHIILKNKKLYFDKYKVKCAIGKRGIKKFKKEGDKSTPKGRFNFGFILYRQDRIKKIRHKIKVLKINKNMGWCDDVRSKNYNKLIKLPTKLNHEKLHKINNTYDIIITINYNHRPVIKNKGSAIFIHIAKNNYKATSGCIAVKKKDMKKILDFITPKSKIIIN